MKYVKLVTLFFCLFMANIQASCYHTENCTPCPKHTKTHGCYVGLLGGVDFFDINKTTARIEPGYYLNGTIGYKFFNNFRVEAEVGYQRGEIKHAGTFISRLNLRRVCGHLRSWSYMVNTLVDFDFNLPVIPYFGSGFGYTETKIHWTGHSTNAGYQVTSKRYHAAFQLIAGIKYHICRGLEASIDYRYVMFNDDFKMQKLGLALTRYF